jgi:hypothetical protein
MRASKLRLKGSDLKLIDRLKAEIGVDAREDVIQAALQVLSSEEGKPFRESRRFENAVNARVDELRERYGPNARMEVILGEGNRPSMEIDGQKPEQLRAELRPLVDMKDVARLVVVDERTGLEFRPGVALELDEWRRTVWVPLTHLFGRIGPERFPVGAAAAPSA